MARIYQTRSWHDQMSPSMEEMELLALEAYARQSGVRLVYLSEDVRDRRTAGARGDMSQDAALNRLLAGTGLTVKRDQSGALAIVQEGANTPTPTRNAPTSGVGQAGPDASYSASLSGGAGRVRWTN